VRIGVLSDTHGVLHPRVFDLFRNVNAIVHAGDVGSTPVMADLEAIAPVFAVRGNADVGTALERLPDERIVELHGVRLLVTHVGGTAAQIEARFGARLRREGIRVFVFGHSHRSLVAELPGTGILLLNPGGAGRRRFSLPLTAALLELREEPGPLEVRLVDLDDTAAVERAQGGG
jgi:putative phosphoesterase